MSKRKYKPRPKPCWCMGYWFPHRTGGGCCESAPMTTQIRCRAARTGEDALQLIADYLWDYKQDSRELPKDCPF